MSSNLLLSYRLAVWIMWLNYAGLVFAHSLHFITITHVVAMAVFMIIIEVWIRMGLNHDNRTKA